MEPCSCKSEECGCQDKSNAIPTPKCDGSSIPKVSLGFRNNIDHNTM